VVWLLGSQVLGLRKLFYSKKEAARPENQLLRLVFSASFPGKRVLKVGEMEGLI